MSNKTTEYLGCGLAGILALGLVLYLAMEWTYLVHGVSTTATVTDVQVRRIGFTAFGDDGRGGTPLYEQRISYHYQDTQGSTLEGESVSETQMITFRRGQTIRIRYLDNAPAISRIASGWRLSDVSLGLLLSLGLGGGIVVLAVWWTRQFSFLPLVSNIGAFLLRPRSKNRRRARMRQTPFPYSWLGYLHKNVRVYGLLTPAEQVKLQNDLRIFANEKKWEGCGGLTITDEIKVTISAQACLLLLEMEHDYFSQVPSIVVYPSTFKNPEDHMGPDGVMPDDRGRLGEAWYRGPVVLSWDEVLVDGQGLRPGHNVVYHEFAHQLDFLGEWQERKPPAEEQNRRSRWQEVMKAEYNQLVKDFAQERATLLDEYGATNPAEFFAVATECFFELPIQMQQRHPQLYEVLRGFYGQDTVKRQALRGGGAALAGSGSNNIDGGF